MNAPGQMEGDSDGDAPSSPGTLRDLTEAEAAAEFETLADNIPTLCWMARADGHIYWYNRRWYEYTGTSIETQEGWGWESVHDPEALPAVLAAWRQSLATGQDFEMTFPLKGADGKFRPFLTRIVPIRDQSGAIVRWFGTNTDIESLHLAQQALQQRTAELASLYESAPIGLAFFDREYRYLRINSELATANGLPAEQHIGRTAREIVGDSAGAVEGVIDRVFETGQTVRDLEISATSPNNPSLPRHWLTGFYPIFDGGAVVAVGAWVLEISERKAAQERETLLAREVDHRAKNLLAVVQSIVQLTPGENGPELKKSVVGRIQALARAHSLLSDSRWDGVALGELVREELTPFASHGSTSVVFEGPALTLRPAAAQSLALVLHELATNAAKYGALSDTDGRLQVEWKRDDGVEGRPFLDILWTESGGPPVEKPEAFGFGSNIIRASVERQLRGQVIKDWRPEGLVATLRIPWSEVVRGGEG